MPFGNRLVSAEEFQRTPAASGRRFELVRGRVIGMVAPGGRHASVALRLGALLLQHADATELGTVFDAVGCRLETGPDTIRVPDLAFVRRARLDPKSTPRGFLEPPDLAVEITSPNDTRTLITRKVAEYLASGVGMVWVLDPDTETIEVHTREAEPLTLRKGDILDGGKVVPGFSCAVERIFR